jgi:hypothetical protein
VAARVHRQRLAPLAGELRATRDLPAVRHLVVLPSQGQAAVPAEVLLAARPAGEQDFTVSYAPSATVLTWLLERPPRKKSATPRLPALGAPAFRAAAVPAPAPTRGVLILAVAPEGSAARAGLQAGDVLLRLGDKKTDSADDVLAGVRAAGAKRAPVPTQLWRAGRTLEVLLPPGSPGIALDRRPIAQALRSAAQRQAFAALLRGSGFRPLPGTRREVNAIAKLFDKSTLLLGESASAEKLTALASSGQLRAHRHLQLATHGLANARTPFESYLALAGNGKLRAADVLRTWKLDADLVVLSACQTGLGPYETGEGYVGFAQALFLAGARSLVLSQWSVDDEATALLMVRFYQNLLGKRKGLKKPLPKAEALREAKHWLRNLSAKEVTSAVGSLPRGKVVPRRAARKEAKPFAHPAYWAAFLVIGEAR